MDKSPPHTREITLRIRLLESSLVGTMAGRDLVRLYLVYGLARERRVATYSEGRRGMNTVPR